MAKYNVQYCSHGSYEWKMGIEANSKDEAETIVQEWINPDYTEHFEIMEVEAV